MIAKTTLLGILFGFALFSASADTVPALLSYQGRVTDANGTPIGNATPVNRTVTFRLYHASTGGAAVYAETQTVTISAGEFSVLIGNGTGVSGSPGPSSPATTPYRSLSDVINGSSFAALYLGITVDDGNSGTVDPEISPRQQLVSGAFSLRAKVAESVAGGAISTAMIADSAVSTNQIHSNAITSAKIADGSIIAADLASSSVTAAKIDTNSIGLWTPSGSGLYRPTGNIGIGQSNPYAPLNFASTQGNKIALHGNGANHYGFGIGSGLLQIYTGHSGSDVAFGYGDSLNLTETMRIKGNGHVGIGTKTPAARLDIGGTVLLNGTSGRNYFKDSEKSDGNGLRVGAAWNKYGIYAESGAGVLGGAGGASLQNDALFVNTAGNVGIGTTNPSVPLSFANTLGEKISLWGSTGSTYGFGIQGNTLQIYSPTTSTKVSIGRGSSSSMTEILNVYGDGKVGIGTTNTGQGTLNIDGSLTTIGSMDGRTSYARFRYDNRGVSIDVYNSNHDYYNWRTALFNGDSNWDFYSDARLKKNIVDAESVLDRVLQLRLRRFQWHDQAEDAASEFGVIAQEVQPLFPDLISVATPVGQTEERLTVGYTGFATIAIKAIQELKERSDQEKEALLSEIEAMSRRFESENLAKDTKIADLEARLTALETLLVTAN